MATKKVCDWCGGEPAVWRCEISKPIPNNDARSTPIGHDLCHQCGEKARSLLQGRRDAAHGFLTPDNPGKDPA